MSVMFGSRGARVTLAMAVAAALVAGCGGSGTKVVTSKRPPTPLAGSSSTLTTGSAGRSAPSSTSSAPGAGSGGTPAQGTARTESAPAYAHEESSSGALAKAQETVRAHGYAPASSADYRPEQTLRVLVGTRNGSAEGHPQQAFFFLGERYLGTDSSEPSGAVHVISQGDTEVTLGYSIYRTGNSLCCPSGGEAHVTFQLNNGTLVPVQSIPSVSERR
jgi:LppP/LprE lipoprotein